MKQFTSIGEDDNIVEFSSKLKKKMKMIELPTSLFNLLESENPPDLIIKGDKDKDNAVLCTDSITFSMKQVEVSNSVFLIPPSNSLNFKIVGSCSDYIELFPTPGNLDNLESSILSLIKNKNKNIEKTILKSTLASEKEIYFYYKIIGVKKINKEIFLLNFDLALNFIYKIFLFISEQEVNIEKSVKLKKFYKYFLNNKRKRENDEFSEEEDEENNIDQNFSSKIEILYTLLLLSDLDEYDEVNEDDEILLSKEKFYRYGVHLVFNNDDINEKKIKYDKIVLDWSIITPNSSIEEFDKKFLEGIAIPLTTSQKIKDDEVIYQYLPLLKLSKSYEERLKQIFSVTNGLPINVLSPYFVEFLGSSDNGKFTSIEMLLLKSAKERDGLYYQK